MLKEPNADCIVGFQLPSTSLSLKSPKHLSVKVILNQTGTIDIHLDLNIVLNQTCDISDQVTINN